MINITEDARVKLVAILEEEKVKAIRFGLQGGGCSGFSYYFGLEDEISEDDVKISIDDTHIMVVDVMSIMYLTGASIDYKSDLNGDTFVFDNPNATTTCGCSKSASFD